MTRITDAIGRISLKSDSLGGCYDRAKRYIYKNARRTHPRGRHSSDRLATRAHSSDISLKVTISCVTLTGFVHSYFEKRAAERAAKAIYGVISVANDIEVKSSSVRRDPEIARDIVRAFKLHAGVPDEKIKITVRGGAVTLEGTLDWHYQMENAEMAVYAIHGVRSIVNKLKIKPTVSSQRVRENIEEAWRRMVDLDHRSMSVVTTAGTVDLYGSVHP